MSDVDTFAVILGRDRQYVEAPLDSTGRIAAVVLAEAEEGDEAYQYVSAADATFGALHPVSQSELLYALLARGEQGKAPPAPPRPRSGPASRDGAGPVAAFVEAAKTGRSKCVVCGQGIEKGAQRVGFEREIDTPQFQGRANVFVHAMEGCIAGCPELQGFRLDA